MKKFFAFKNLLFLIKDSKPTQNSTQFTYSFIKIGQKLRQAEDEYRKNA